MGTSSAAIDPGTCPASATCASAWMPWPMTAVSKRVRLMFAPPRLSHVVDRRRGVCGLAGAATKRISSGPGCQRPHSGSECAMHRGDLLLLLDHDFLRDATQPLV